MNSPQTGQTWLYNGGGEIRRYANKTHNGFRDHGRFAPIGTLCREISVAMTPDAIGSRS